MYLNEIIAISILVTGYIGMAIVYHTIYIKPLDKLNKKRKDSE